MYLNGDSRKRRHSPSSITLTKGQCVGLVQQVCIFISFFLYLSLKLSRLDEVLPICLTKKFLFNSCLSIPLTSYNIGEVDLGESSDYSSLRVRVIQKEKGNWDGM